MPYPDIAMLRNALEFLTDELNAYLQVRDPVNFQDAKTAVLTNLVKPDGTFAANASSGQGNDKFSIAVTLINMEQDRVAESQNFYRREKDKVQVVEPPLNLNLYVLFSAVADKYSTALTLLDHVLGFFQSHPVFDDAGYPHLNSKADPLQPWTFIQRMVTDLHTLTLEQQNNLWASLGAKYMPSAMYKIRTLTYHDVHPKSEGLPITEINLRTH